MSKEDDTPPPTSAVLMSISKHLAVKCSKQSKDYIECKRRDKNPESCLKEGDTVTSCGIETSVPRPHIPVPVPEHACCKHSCLTCFPCRMQTERSQSESSKGI